MLVRSSVCVVIPTCKNMVASSSRIEAEVPEWFRFSLSPSLELVIDNKDNEAMPQKKAKISDPATQAAVDTLWISLLTMRVKMHSMLGFLTKFQAHAKIAEAYLATQQKEMEAILEKL